MPGMEQGTGSGIERVQLTTADGHVLDGDLAVPERPRGAVVLCHPHPQYGGSRFDQVVSRLFDALPPAGFAALRFDFRRSYGGAVDERLDAAAAVELLAERVPDVPLHLFGYSFGAIVALGVHDDRLASHVLLAPPLGADFPEDPPGSGPLGVIVAEHDQFCPPPAVASAIADWPETRVRTVAMADHFFAGRTDAVVAEVLALLTEPSA